MLLNNDKDINYSSMKRLKILNINKKLGVSSNMEIMEMMEVMGMMEMMEIGMMEMDGGTKRDVVLNHTQLALPSRYSC